MAGYFVLQKNIFKENIFTSGSENKFFETSEKNSEKKERQKSFLSHPIKVCELEQIKKKKSKGLGSTIGRIGHPEQKKSFGWTQN